MTSLRKGDADLHHEDGSHRATAATTSGRDLERFELRMARHLAEHAANNDQEG